MKKSELKVLVDILREISSNLGYLENKTNDDHYYDLTDKLDKDISKLEGLIKDD